MLEGNEASDDVSGGPGAPPDPGDLLLFSHRSPGTTDSGEQAN